MKRTAPISLVAVVVVLAPCAGRALGAQIYRYDPGGPAADKPALRHTSKAQAPRPERRGVPHAAAPRAPSGPPLVAGTAGEATSAAGAAGALAGGDASSSAPSSGGDPLVENGLGSPLCGSGASDLSPQSLRNCATSGFEAAGAPTGDYGLDVHIDTGALGFTVATLEQDYVIAPVWMGLVWVAHTLVVAIEWGFTLDLLSGSAMTEVERALRGAQTSFTRPLLAVALALAAVGVAYNGLVRRRVAETLGDAVLMLAMMASGLWVIADPAGTVGALGHWTDAISAGALGTIVEGSPARPRRTLADSMSGLFTGVVGDPWCYLEFGAVRWCDEPALMDQRLRSAGLRIAAAGQSGGCGGGSDVQAACEVIEDEQPAARAQGAKLLRAARTNGELFLALPANQAARNSINDSASLLRALCGGSSDATGCRGPTAPQAEFRTQGGTAPRVGGLLLIALGSLGMLLLFGYLALQLLGAELLSLLYLLLAPAAVLAPALGDGGRAVFRAWAGRLMGAVVSKLLFSFLLGVVLLLTRTLLGLYAFGWWTRWLLVSATWWGAYLQRRHFLGLVQGELRVARHHGGRDRAGLVVMSRHASRSESIARWTQRALKTPLAATRSVGRAAGGLPVPVPHADPRSSRDAAPGGEETSAPSRAAQTTRMLKQEHAQARDDLADAPRVQAEVGERREQLARVRSARVAAAAAGDTRRTAVLDVRARRIEEEVVRREHRLDATRKRVAAGETALRQTGSPHTPGEVMRRERLLDAQAALPERQRDHAALASLAGYGREQYERLDPRHRREARVQIDRELALRVRPNGAAGHPASSAARVSCEPRPAEASSESVATRDARGIEARRKRFLELDL